LDFNEIRQLLATIAQTDIAELVLKSDDFELTVRKAVSLSNQVTPVAPAALGGVVGAELAAISTAAPQVPTATATETVISRTTDTAVSAQVQMSATAPSRIEAKLYEIKSPMVGTFYRSPAPTEPAFVEVGDRIRSDQTVCIIEAMKLMNEIEAEVSGQVMEILVQNGEPVEYGQILMRVKPD
jgi:acetyl-CoA carboxylase biotin carboxyl carrier protein